MSESMTTEESALEHAYKDVLTKIGRNLICFQRAEQILKEISKLIGISISMDDPQKSIAAWEERVTRMTLGTLSTRFTDTYLLGKEHRPPENPERLGKGLMVFRLSIDNDPETLAKRRESLNLLVSERNWLVHQLLPDFDRNSLQACLEMAVRLDRQREAILPEIERLRSDYLNIHKIRQMIPGMLLEPENIASLRECLISQHPLIAKLEDIAREIQEPGGWVALSTATKRLTDFPPEEITKICKGSGVKSLKELLIASGQFDVELVPVGTKRHRVIYRLKSHHSVSMNGDPRSLEAKAPLPWPTHPLTMPPIDQIPKVPSETSHLVISDQ